MLFLEAPPRRGRGPLRRRLRPADRSGGIQGSCDIHTHTPARKSYTAGSLCYFGTQTVLGMGMGMNVTAP